MSRYEPLEIWRSCPWPLGITWYHRSCDNSTRNVPLVHWNIPYVAWLLWHYVYLAFIITFEMHRFIKQWKLLLPQADSREQCSRLTGIKPAFRMINKKAVLSQGNRATSAANFNQYRVWRQLFVHGRKPWISLRGHSSRGHTFLHKSIPYIWQYRSQLSLSLLRFQTYCSFIILCSKD